MGSLLVGWLFSCVWQCIQAYSLISITYTSIRVFDGVSKHVRRGKTKRSPPSPPRMISVRDIFPNTTGAAVDISVCIFSTFSPEDVCTQRPNKTDRSHAIDLWNTLASHRPNEASMKQILNTYVNISVCNRHRNGAFAKIVGKQLDSWLRELQVMYEAELDMAIKDVGLDPEDSINGYMSSELKYRFCHVREITPSPPGGFPQNRLILAKDKEEECTPPRDRDLFMKALELARSGYKNQLITTRDVPEAGSENPDQGEVDQTTMFVPKKPGKGTLSDLIIRPLTVKEYHDGHIYIYQSASSENEQDQAFSKIGYTTGTPEARIQAWSAACGRQLDLKHAKLVKHAKRVEQLIHQELETLGKRRNDLRCKNERKKCTSVHNEWFEVTKAEAVQIVEHWSSWMQEHDPYDFEGRLQPGYTKQMFDFQVLDGELLDETGDGPEEVHSLFLLDSRGGMWHETYWDRYIRQRLTPINHPVESSLSDSTPRKDRSTSTTKKDAQRQNNGRSRCSQVTGNGPALPSEGTSAEDLETRNTKTSDLVPSVEDSDMGSPGQLRMPKKRRPASKSLTKRTNVDQGSSLTHLSRHGSEPPRHAPNIASRAFGQKRVVSDTAVETLRTRPNVRSQKWRTTSTSNAAFLQSGTLEDPIEL